MAGSRVNYLVNESDGAINMHYAYLFTLQGRVTTHTQACAVLGHKFADLREAEGRWRPWAEEANYRRKRQEVQQEEEKNRELDKLRAGHCLRKLMESMLPSAHTGKAKAEET